MNAQHNNLATPAMSLGATGRAFHTREPAQIHDFRDSSVQLWRETAEREGIASFIATPLVFQGRVLGFINCYTRQPHVFVPAEVELLRIIGNQAAIAVEAAGLFDRQHQRALELDRLNQQLEEQRVLLQRQNTLLRQGEQIHQQLTEVILQDAGLAAIVGRIADLIARPVQLYDARLEQLATSVAPGDWHFAIEPRMWDGQPFRLSGADPSGAWPRYVVPIGTDNPLLGYLVVVEGAEPLQGLDLRAVEYGATVVALELLKQRAVSQVEQQLRGGLLDDLLGGDYESVEELTRRARQLGFDPRRPYRVLALSLDEPRHAASWQREINGERRQRQLVDCVVLVAQTHWPASLVTVRGEVVALVCQADTPAADMAGLLREDLKRALHGGTVSVGVGSTCREVSQFAESFSEARYCLDLIRRLENEDRSLCIEDLGLHRFLIGTQHKTQLTTFAHERLDRLIAYETQHAGDLLATLTSYLAADCSLVRTAQSLVVHANTVQYRLRRVEELTGVRVRATHGLLELQLALLIGVLVPREFPELSPYAPKIAAAVAARA
jgi:sugar diacid utilization regulator